ncbi:MAG TPA: hypothetical protein VFN57_08255 [Thermomicrobiaceae bacterium]|nr:hypothetical protein [Thermomicrobiaceae bacterium]
MVRFRRRHARVLPARPSDSPAMLVDLAADRGTDPLIPIPRPLVLPNVTRRQILKAGMAGAALLAVAPAAVVTRPAVPAAAGPSLPPLMVDGPIYKKWLKLGGAATVGNATAAEAATPDGGGLYQTFTNGVIVYSSDWGAMLLSQPIYAYWAGLYGQDGPPAPAGENLLTYVGYPTQDYVVASGVQTGYFERGMVVVNGGTTRLVAGFIYEHYFVVTPSLGLPVSDQASAPGGGLSQSFQGGDIYWRLGTAAAAAIVDPIRARWLATGGAAGTLGYPLGDQRPVAQEGSGVAIGSSQHFQNGAIYASPATGAWEVTGAVVQAYEQQYGGANAPNGFGFPIGAPGTSPGGGNYSDFQGGVIVNFPSGPNTGTWAFGDLQLYLNQFQAPDEDCFLGVCVGVDLYVFLKVTTNNGLNISQRLPSSGDYGTGDVHPNLTYDLTPGGAAHSGLVIDIDLDGWDTETVGGDENLGHVHVTYDLDNVFGLMDSGPHFNETDGNGVTFDFGVKPAGLPFDPTKFRQEMFWSFSNFITDPLTWAQFASTFSDVDPNESVWTHPFDHLFFELAYKHLAKNGNCFGMCLESIYAQIGASLYAEPIITYWPDTQNGQDLSTTNHTNTINTINVRHGYQIGALSIDWFLANLVIGATHDPKGAFQASRDAFNRGDWPILSLMKDYFGGGGHAVRPYRWDDSNPNQWVISIANPNNPAAANADGDPPCIITIDPNANTFTFQFDSGDTWTGGSWTGGRMYSIPFSVVSSAPVTPFWEVLALLAAGVLILLGDTGQTQQITDQNGNTLFEPGLGAPPTRWDQLTQNPANRVPNLAPVPFSDGGGAPIPLQMFYGKGAGMSYTHAVVPAPGVPDGTPYEWTIQTPTLSAQLLIPGTPGSPDVLTAANLHTANKAVTVNLPSRKTITWTMAGPVKQRWFQLSNLSLAGGQQLTTSVANSGYEFSFQNSGPATSATLTVQAGPGAAPVNAGTITIPNGASGPFSFAAPKTTLTTTPPASNGKAGWFVVAITVTLTALDYSSTGIQSIQYSKDGTTWTTYSGPFSYGGPGDYADEGVTTLDYYATDDAGDVESVESSTLMVDTRAPTLASTLPATFTRVAPLVIGYSATDPAPGSGVDASSVGGVFNGGTYTNAAVTDGQSLNMFWEPLGTYTLTVSASDIAGNAASQVFTTQLIATLASLATEIRQMRQMGLIDSDGVEQSFLAKVAAATDAFNRGQRNAASNQLGALLHELAAQSGSHITAPAATLLSGDVSYVQSHLT